MSDYLNILCGYLIGFQIVETIIDFYYYAPICGLVRIFFFIVPLWYVCGVVTGRY